MRNNHKFMTLACLIIMLLPSPFAHAQYGGFDYNQFAKLKTYMNQLHSDVMTNIPCESRECARYEKNLKRKFDRLIVEPMYVLSDTAQQMTKQNSNFKPQSSRFVREMYPVLGQYQQIIDRLCQSWGDEQVKYTTACIHKTNYDYLIPFLLEPHYDNFISDYEDKHSLTTEGDIVALIWRDYVTSRNEGLRNVPIPENFREAAAPIQKKHAAKLASIEAEKQRKARAEIDARDARVRKAAAEQAKAQRKAELLFAQCRIEIDGQILALRPDNGSGDAEVTLHLTPYQIRKEGLHPSKWSEYAIRATSDRFDSSQPQMLRYSKIEVAVGRPRIPPRTAGFKFMGQDVDKFYVNIKKRSNGTDTKQIVSMEQSGETYRLMTYERGKGAFQASDGSITYKEPPQQIFNWLKSSNSPGELTLELSTKIKQTFSSTDRWGSVTTDTYENEPFVAFDYRMPKDMRADNIAEVFRRLRQAREEGACTPK